MKRRVIKKWMNRYITPMVKWMPKTTYGVLELTNERDPNQRKFLKGANCICVNGEWKQEGERSAPSKGLCNDIKNTADALADCMELFSNPHLRKIDADRKYGMYLRIIDFADWPEGYVHIPDDEEGGRLA